MSRIWSGCGAGRGGLAVDASHRSRIWRRAGDLVIGSGGCTIRSPGWPVERCVLALTFGENGEGISVRAEIFIHPHSARFLEFPVLSAELRDDFGA